MGRWGWGPGWRRTLPASGLSSLLPLLCVLTLAQGTFSEHLLCAMMRGGVVEEEGRVAHTKM